MRALQLLLALTAVLSLSGCELIATVFEVGVWVGVIAVLVLVGLVALLISFFRR
jgi:hypothetical protein